MTNINRLLKDICVRYAEKHVDSYVKDLEKALGIKVDPGSDKHEYVYKAIFDFCNTSRFVQKCILDFGHQQTMFSVEECSRNARKVHAIFKFHPENAT